MNLKRTVLYPEHLRLGAKMVEFGGWEMPVQYTGVIQEHNAVREHAGMFDVSHMGQFRFKGENALNFLQSITPNDVSKLKTGKAQYNMLPNATGGLVDDIYIYMLAPNDYLMVVNAANIEKDEAHIRELLPADVEFINESDQWALIAVQGPETESRLQPFSEVDLSTKKKNNVFQNKLFGYPVLMARTGYTGEDGFEVFVENANAAAVWDKLIEIGITPCGLAARDTLRLEAGYPLYGHEFKDDVNPLATHYKWVFKDKDYHGKEAIQNNPPKHSLIGLKLDKVPAREGYPVKRNGQVIGYVTSGSQSPTLKHPIAMAYVDSEHLKDGNDEFLVEIRNKDVPATLVQVPFV